tara:strand:+ start:701 stop:871 length:171 start_codon:yes stop_codon:yes gene_type:complete
VVVPLVLQSTVAVVVLVDAFIILTLLSLKQTIQLLLVLVDIRYLLLLEMMEDGLLE